MESVNLYPICQDCYAQSGEKSGVVPTVLPVRGMPRACYAVRTVDGHKNKIPAHSTGSNNITAVGNIIIIVIINGGANNISTSINGGANNISINGAGNNISIKGGGNNISIIGNGGGNDITARGGNTASSGGHAHSI